MNTPTAFRNNLSALMRSAEDSDWGTDDFTNGCNLPASNAPGIGVAIGYGALPAETVPPHTMNWTEDDQFAAARTPQVSQSIGQDAFVPRTGNVATTWDSSQALYTPNGAASSGGLSGNGSDGATPDLMVFSNPDNDAAGIPVPGATSTVTGEASLVTLAAGWISTAVP